MARYEFKLPDIGEGIAEAEIVAWHVKVGDTIGEDQQIADMMTDKATVEMESPVAGKVIELAGEVGDQIPIGSVLAVIETEGADRAARAGRGQRGRAPARRRRGPGDARAGERDSGHQGRGRRTVARACRSAAPPSEAGARQASRSARTATVERTSSPPPPCAQRARDLGIDLGQVKTASDRIRHSDLDAYLLYNGGTVSARGPARPAQGRDDQGRRPAPQDRREHAGGEAPDPAFHPGRGIRRHRRSKTRGR